MGKPYSMDLRQRVVAAIEGGLSTRQAAARFAIGIATAGTWARLKRATGAVRPAKQGKPKGACNRPPSQVRDFFAPRKRAGVQTSGEYVCAAHRIKPVSLPYPSRRRGRGSTKRNGPSEGVR